MKILRLWLQYFHIQRVAGARYLSTLRVGFERRNVFFGASKNHEPVPRQNRATARF